MRSSLCILLSLLLVMSLTACSGGVASNGADNNADDRTQDSPADNSDAHTDEADRRSQTRATNPGTSTGTDDEQIEEVHGAPPRRGLSFIETSVTSEDMRVFEAEHAVSDEQERYLAFGAFVMTNNYESIRVFALDASAGSAERLLRDFWSIEDKESAREQLSRLSIADGQAPIANEIYNIFVKNDFLEPLTPTDVFILRTRGEFEHLHRATTSQAERMQDEFNRWVVLLEEDVGRVDGNEAFELFVIMLMTERINRGLEAYVGARRLLINHFGYTEKELLNLPSLDAWDYGRVAIIARYGAQSGYLTENEAWQHLKLAADSASEVYSGWREYTAAHIIGRALAFGSTSEDFRDALEFLLNHPESSFQTIDFKGS